MGLYTLIWVASLKEKTPLLNKKILVVEDEDMIRELLKDELEDFGAQVVEATNGKEALEYCNKEKFSLIITDLRMPGFGGVQFVKELYKQKEQSEKLINPNVIVLTGNIDYDANELKSNGVLEVFFKPINFNEFLDYVCEATGN